MSDSNIDVPEPLSAKFQGSFAYLTIKDRLPVILGKVADTVYRKKTAIKEEYGQEGVEDLKSIAGCVSKLRNEEQTNKPVIPLEDDRPDTSIWNTYLQEEITRQGEPPSWFMSPWLYVECYLYRRIQEAVEKCQVLKSLDVFGDQKQKALLDSQSAVLILLEYTMKVVNDLEEGKELNLHKLFKQFSQVALWGNKCDLSISAGFENSQKSCPLDQVETLKEYILVDNLEELWSCTRKHPPGRIDIVLDNAGFELVTDLCLAEFLLASNLATSITFHAKAFPWFVSDVTQQDFNWTLDTFAQSNSIAMNFFVQRWRGRLQDSSWQLHDHMFWTLPFDFSEMKKYSPDLYHELGLATAVFFKGDLNYRKLTGDRKWDTTVPFHVSLRGFHPAPLCTLRALKADVVTGLQPGQGSKVEERDSKWMVNGNWAVMSFCDKRMS